MVGVSKNTVLKLLVEVGEFCAIYQDNKLRKLRCQRIEADEIWAFVGAKARNATRQGDGDIWMYTALDSDTKLMVSWFVGHKDVESASLFMADLASRLANRVQLTTDGYTAYLGAVEGAFGWNGVDYAMLVKKYGVGLGSSADRVYSPPVCVGADKHWIMGRPNRDKISTSYVERSNLTIRLHNRRFTRLTNAFSKKVQNHAHAVALHFMFYNFCRKHQTLTKAAKGVHTTPAMASGLTDHVWTIEEVLGLMDPKHLVQCKGNTTTIPNHLA